MKESTTKLVVYKVIGGYQVFSCAADGKRTPVAKEKVYFHPTSAYAALGRLQHVENIKALKLASDPAKAPAKEPAAK